MEIKDSDKILKTNIINLIEKNNLTQVELAKKLELIQSQLAK